MTDFSGNVSFVSLPATDVSTNLSAYSSPPTAFGGWTVVYAAGAGSLSISAVSVSGEAYSSTWHPLYERFWWNAVHIIPSGFDLGFVVSQVQKTFEVFNNWRHAQTLTGITFDQGGAGMFVETGPAPPAHFAQSQSRMYSLRVTTDGAPQIADAMNFNYGAFSVRVSIQGNRLIAFSVSPDWSFGITESISYMTDIMRAYDTTEQRVQLRDIPRRKMRFKPMSESDSETALLRAILYDWQSRPYGVPIWQDIDKTTSDVALGATVINVTTAGKQYEVGQLAFIWKNAAEWEAFQVTAISGSSITIASPTQKAWPLSSGAWITPMRIGRLSESESITGLSQRIAEIQLTFDIEGVN